MRVVAIGADHEAFVDAMLESQGELRAHIVVATVAQVDLARRKEEFRHGRFVDRVAVCADDITECMRRAADIGAADGLGVASQACVENIVGRKLGERDDGGLAAACPDMLQSGAVAAFAAGVFRLGFTRRDALEVWIAVEILPNVGMAGAANLAANVIGGEGQRRREAQREHPGAQAHCSNIANP